MILVLIETRVSASWVDDSQFLQIDHLQLIAYIFFEINKY